ncbi:MAG: hypothetical protein HXX12_15715 [Geothrix sp.]|uniref:hypothetical protein n=1 Tax=Geothrix sp. TaxID=1962974 RepID=UPI00183D0724|nr:hypothetical protein [Geothrix sp.]NWJ42408.1 hypothetical protein [Geothrix sp.]WIL19626.1 MAG: hypothetical protein QOZ81_002152 [Geothrix sp.]
MSTAEVFPPERHAADSPSGALESRLAGLAETISRLEARVAALEGRTPERAVSVVVATDGSPRTAAPAPATADLPNPIRLMGLIGRTCLILGGATFIRALVDAGTIHRGWGVALGLAFAITWAILADRAKHPLDSAFHALASILIAYPLLVESTARFGILEPGLAAFLLLVVTGLHSAVAWRRDLQPIIWLAILTSLGSGFAVMTSRRAIEPFLMVFLVLGLGSLWATYGRRWHGLRWPTALAANLGVLILTSLAAWPGGAPEIYRGLSPARAMVLALALVVLYLGSFAVRMLQQRRVVNAFEKIQTILALLVGFGGAFRVALATGSGTGVLGAGASVAGLGCYATALRFAEDHEETRANFNFFTFLALILVLLGGSILLPQPIFGLLAAALGLGAMVAGLHLRRAVLFVQSGIFLLAGAVACGLLGWSFRAFLAPGGAGAPMSLPGLLCLGLLAGAVAWFLLHRPSDAITRRVRPLILGLGAVAAIGAGALAVRTFSAALSSGAPQADLLAALRTGVLSLLAIAMAWFGRRMPILELRWLVYPVLIVTALKFLFEDLAVGRPLTLFLGFMCFGATLMLAPRLLKAPAPKGGGDDPNTSIPEVDS